MVSLSATLRGEWECDVNYCKMDQLNGRLKCQLSGGRKLTCVLVLSECVQCRRSCAVQYSPSNPYVRYTCTYNILSKSFKVLSSYSAKTNQNRQMDKGIFSISRCGPLAWQEIIEMFDRVTLAF